MPILLLALLIFNSSFGVTAAQSQSPTYAETRNLLLKMDGSHADQQLKKLFEEADTRMPDLIKALDDSEQRVSLNSQVVINYLADPEGLKAIDDWKKRQTGTYSTPNMKLLSENIYLHGNDSDLVNLMQKNRHLLAAARFNEGDISIELVGYNKKTKTALFEVIQGQTFTAGWHTVIKLEDGKWRLISDNNVWVS